VRAGGPLLVYHDLSMHQTWSSGEWGGGGGERWAATAMEHGYVYWGEGGRPHPHDMSMHQTWSGGERGGEGGGRWAERALSAREPRGWSLAAHDRPTNLQLPPPQPPPQPLGDSFGLTLANCIERRPTLFRETQEIGLFGGHAVSRPVRGSEYTDPLGMIEAQRPLQSIMSEGSGKRGSALTSSTDSIARLPPSVVMPDLSVAESRSFRTHFQKSQCTVTFVYSDTDIIHIYSDTDII
jgi:hypothetical protein